MQRFELDWPGSLNTNRPNPKPSGDPQALSAWLVTIPKVSLRRSMLKISEATMNLVRSDSQTESFRVETRQDS